ASTRTGAVRLDFANDGEAAVVLQVRSGHTTQPPRTYTLEAGTQLSDTWAVTALPATEYDLAVYGPNGFLRSFKGSVSASRARLDVEAAYDEGSNQISLAI